MDERELIANSECLCIIIGELAACTVFALEYIINENSQIDKDTLVETMKSSINHFNRFIAQEGDD